jgi:hypothetical protein
MASPWRPDSHSEGSMTEPETNGWQSAEDYLKTIRAIGDCGWAEVAKWAEREGVDIEHLIRVEERP